MNRWLLAASLSLASFLWLTGCATDDDEPFATHSSVNSDVPVAGAATPAPDSSNAGWKW